MSYLKIFSICFAIILTTLTVEARKKIDPEAERIAKDLRNKYVCLRALNKTARELGMPYSEQKIQIAEFTQSSCYFCGNGSEDNIYTHPMLWRRSNGKDVYVSLSDISGPNLKKKAPVVSLLEFDRGTTGPICLVNKKRKQLTRTFNIRADGQVTFDSSELKNERCGKNETNRGLTLVQPKELEEEEASNRQASLFSELDAEIERMINYASYDRIKGTVERRSKWREQVRNPKVRYVDTPYFTGKYEFAPEECDQAVTRTDLKDRMEQAREDVINLSKWSREIEKTEDNYKDEKNNAVLMGKKRASVKRKANPPAPAPATLDGSYTAPTSTGSTSQGTN